MKNNHKTISPKVLRKNLFFYSASIFLIFSLFLILTITVPVYDRLKASENSKVIHDSEIRAMAVNEWSRRVKDLAFQITSRTRIRQELEKYNNGEISLTQLQSFTEPKLSDAMKLSEEIIGIVRLDRKGIPVAQCGEKFSYHDASIDYTKSFDLSLSKPFRRNGRCRVFVSAPIFNRLKVYVGADLVLIDLCFLEKIVNSESGFQKGHDTVLGYFSEGDVSILFKDKAENQNRIYKELIAPLLIKACHGESGINSNSFDHVTAYHSLGIKNWGLLVLQNKEDLYKTINTRFIYWGITAAIAYMAILAIFWFLTAPLANRLLIHTDELKETIKEKTTYLKDEIKERKKAEEKQKRTANFLSALLNAVPTPIFYKDKEGLYQGCNKEFSSFMGVTPDDIQGKRVDELWPGDQAVVYHQKDLDLMRNPCHQVYEFKVTDKNGEAKPVIFAKDVFRDEEGNVAGIIGAFSDISELKKTQEEIRSLRNYLSNIIDSMPSILIGVDNKTRITHWNIQARKRTRISQDSAKGQSLEKIFPQLPNGTEYVQKAIESRQVYHHSRSPRQEQSRTVYEDITIYPLVANGVEGAVIRIDDATERVQMEEMMTQTEKMLSVGGLAAGMAHEINNPHD